MGQVSAEMLYDLSCIPANSAKGINNRAAFPQKIQNIALLQKKLQHRTKAFCHLFCLIILSGGKGVHDFQGVSLEKMEGRDGAGKSKVNRR